MKALSVIGLPFVAAIIATVPISPQVTPRGLELSVDQAQAQLTYGQARRMERRADRRDRRMDRRADRYDRRAGYTAGVVGGYGYGSGYGYGAGYGYGSGYGYQVVAAGPGRSCAIYPSGFRWCWTQF